MIYQMLKRNINFEVFLKKKSFFLFGARSTGKSFWIKKTMLKSCLYLNLLESELFLRLNESPALLKKIIKDSEKKVIIIDEIQKIPEILNEVHNLIEDEGYHFLLTGSSARKLKRSHANMLGGRAGIINFYPLSFSEIPDFKLEKYLIYGGIPRIYLSSEPELELDSYFVTYLEQEIKLEANIRNLAPFHRFLKTAALNNGELLNYANIASDAAVPASTVKEYYSVLEDSLIGYILEPWCESKKRKAIATSKFYFFDTGVCHYIAGTKALERNSDLWGKSFEQFILMELKTYNSYLQKRKKLYFWRSVSKQEVDFIIDDEIAIEVKSTKKVTKKHLSGLLALNEENIIKKFYLVSDDKINRIEENYINVIYWKDFLIKLWANELY
jgi:predicted AAA+ superfamily ATPase